MNWSTFHKESERLASEAEVTLHKGDNERAQELYLQAAEAERKSLGFLDRSRPRTLGICTVSAAALLYKADQVSVAERFTHEWLARDGLPEFARGELRSLLRDIWDGIDQEQSGVNLSPARIEISMRGGEILHGGAPLDLVIEKARLIQSFIFRTVEFLMEMPLRKRGLP